MFLLVFSKLIWYDLMVFKTKSYLPHLSWFLGVLHGKSTRRWIHVNMFFRWWSPRQQILVMLVLFSSYIPQLSLQIEMGNLQNSCWLMKKRGLYSPVGDDILGYQSQSIVWNPIGTNQYTGTTQGFEHCSHLLGHLFHSVLIHIGCYALVSSETISGNYYWL